MRKDSRNGDYMNLKNKNVLIIGTGISGIAAADLLSEEGAKVFLYDANVELQEEKIRERLRPETVCEIVLGELEDSYYKTTELLVLSPGVPTDLPMVERFKDEGVIVWGEIELAYQFSKGKLAAITGTNGKTTTTALTGEIMKTYYDKVFVVGNIGIPYTAMVKETTDDAVTVAEMSSFQLETVECFRPDVSAVLNITPDHLNRHHTMENYIEAKFNITNNQTPKDTCVLNYEDEVLRKAGDSLQCKILWFSSKRRLEQGLCLEGDWIVYYPGSDRAMEAFAGFETAPGGDYVPVIDVKELNIIGKHNYENAMAAIACAMTLHVPLSCIREALRNFKAVEHRIEFVAEKNGVRYYNDSKGTNPDASIQAVRAMDAATVLIGGGYDKGSEYDEWIASFDGKIKYLVLMGQTKEKIAECARKHGFTSIVFVESMEEAVEFAAKNTAAGERVLLSPCCASWGMFKNYEERGRIFKELVHALP